MIDRGHALSISRQAQLVNISRGSVYYQSKAFNTVDLESMRHIDELHLEHPFMGTRMLRDLLNREGFHVGHKIYPYLLRNLAIEEANQVWALDTTYVPMAKGFSYLTVVVDWASRKVLASKVAITLESPVMPICTARGVYSP